MVTDNHTLENKITQLEKDYAVLSSVINRIESDLKCVRTELTESSSNVLVLKSSVDKHEIYSEKAVNLAVKTVNARLTEMNNFRKTVEDILSKNISRDEHTVVVENLQKQIVDLQLAKSKLEGMATQKSVIGSYAMGAMGLMFGLFGLILNVMKISIG